MTAREILDNIATQQGWSEQTKVDLLCRFVDNLDLLSDHTGDEDHVPILERWLKNKADWENNHGVSP